MYQPHPSLTVLAVLGSVSLTPLAAAPKPTPKPTPKPAPAPPREPDPKPKDPKDPNRFFDVQEWSFSLSQHTFGSQNYREGEGLVLHNVNSFKDSTRVQGTLLWEMLPDPNQDAQYAAALKQVEELRKRGLKVPDVPKNLDIPKVGMWNGDSIGSALVDNQFVVHHTHTGKTATETLKGSVDTPMVVLLVIDTKKGTYEMRAAAGDGPQDVSQRRKKTIQCKLMTTLLERVDVDGKRYEEKRVNGVALHVPPQPLPPSGSELSGTLTSVDPENGKITKLRWNVAPVTKTPKLYLEPVDPAYMPEPNTSAEFSLRWTGKEPTETEFRLANVSTETGTHLNSQDQNADPDVEFAPGQGLTVSGLSASSKSAVRSVKLLAKDYGAYARLTARAMFNGQWVEAECLGTTQPFATLPPDSDGNHVADAWEQLHGKPGAPAESDDDEPQGQAQLGDGFTYYEEYRGLQLEDGQHVRLNPKVKELMVVDKNQLLKPDLWKRATGILALNLKAEQVRMGRVDFNAGFADGKPKYAITMLPINSLVDGEAEPGAGVVVGKWGMRRTAALPMGPSGCASSPTASRSPSTAASSTC